MNKNNLFVNFRRKTKKMQHLRKAARKLPSLEEAHEATHRRETVPVQDVFAEVYMRVNSQRSHKKETHGQAVQMHLVPKDVRSRHQIEAAYART